MIELHAAIFAWPLRYFGPPSRALVVILTHEEELDAVYDAVGVNCIKGAQLLKSRGSCLVYGLRGECEYKV